MYWAQVWWSRVPAVAGGRAAPPRQRRACGGGPRGGAGAIGGALRLSLEHFDFVLRSASFSAHPRVGYVHCEPVAPEAQHAFVVLDVRPRVVGPREGRIDVALPNA